ncbi:MAG: hypothetical protein OXI87_06410 [Albidovulum sp.]|nr:hypothetical protein [Albidovulum sp.]
MVDALAARMQALEGAAANSSLRLSNSWAAGLKSKRAQGLRRRPERLDNNGSVVDHRAEFAPGRGETHPEHSMTLFDAG